MPGRDRHLAYEERLGTFDPEVTFTEFLQEVSYVDPGLTERIGKEFGTFERLRAASDVEIKSVEGVGPGARMSIRNIIESIE